MTKQTIRIIEEHGVKLYDLQYIYNTNKILMFKEYDEGFLSFIRGDEYDILFSAAINNVYGFSMWKDLINFIDKSERPIMVSIGANHERLFKASKRYNYEKVSDNIIIIRK